MDSYLSSTTPLGPSLSLVSMRTGLCFVLHKENWSSFNFDSTWRYEVLVTLHEFYHLYNVLDGGGNPPTQSDTPDGHVMNGGENYNNIALAHCYGNV